MDAMVALDGVAMAPRWPQRGALLAEILVPAEPLFPFVKGTHADFSPARNSRTRNFLSFQAIRVADRLMAWQIQVTPQATLAERQRKAGAACPLEFDRDHDLHRGFKAASFRSVAASARCRW